MFGIRLLDVSDQNGSAFEHHGMSIEFLNIRDIVFFTRYKTGCGEERGLRKSHFFLALCSVDSEDASQIYSFVFDGQELGRGADRNPFDFQCREVGLLLKHINQLVAYINGVSLRLAIVNIGQREYISLITKRNTLALNDI